MTFMAGDWLHFPLTRESYVLVIWVYGVKQEKASISLKKTSVLNGTDFERMYVLFGEL